MLNTKNRYIINQLTRTLSGITESLSAEESTLLRWQDFGTQVEPSVKDLTLILLAEISAAVERLKATTICLVTTTPKSESTPSPKSVVNAVPYPVESDWAGMIVRRPLSF